MQKKEESGTELRKLSGANMRNVEPDSKFSNNLEPLLIKYIHLEPKKNDLEP